jgi:sulfoxide reductase heme-binding subunit YedZ
MGVERRYRLLYKPAVFAACCVPALWLLARGLGLATPSLGADPAREILHVLGRTALNLLLITLTVTPLRVLARNPDLLRLRRMLGLFAFGYAVLHLASYATLELGFDLAALGADVVKRPYITIGMLAILLMAPLAATSTQRMMRRLGRRWQRLHYLVYPVAILGVWHFGWQVKADLREPALYGAILAALLGFRVWHRLARRRGRGPATSTSAPARAPERT